jgi:hypothetical protein
MKRSQWIVLLVSTISAGTAAVGCKPGGVGDPCIPEDEYTSTFSGFGDAEANVESRSFQCETRVCIANHFRGRVSCPYGQGKAIADAVAAAAAAGQSIPTLGSPVSDPPGPCYIPSSTDPVKVAVDSQLVNRRAETTVYCSCRCSGPDKNAVYCQCPSGYDCLPLVPDLNLGQAQLVGQYCLKSGTAYSGTTTGLACQSSAKNCPSDTASKSDMNPGS